MAEGRAFGLDRDTRARLLSRLSARGGAPTTGGEAPEPPRAPLPGHAGRYRELDMIRKGAGLLQIENPFFIPHDGVAGGTTVIGSHTLSNYASYNYVGLNGDPRVSAAAKAAIDRYGTSVSASRIVSGERHVHRALEQSLAAIHGAEDAVAMVSGHATNVTAIGCLFGAGDLIVHDALSHNSVVQGAILSGAHRASFPHNDLAALDAVLTALRPQHKQALIAVEGHYSMDGDVPDLAGLVRCARRHGATILVDEAHSLGVLGANGFGIAEHAGVDPTEIDLWMGTLSKTLASCGGYIAGRAGLIEYLKFTAPGFVFSVGMPPAAAAASLEALDILRAEPWRVSRLQANGARFLAAAVRAGLDTGTSIGAAIVPVIVGSSIRAARIAHALGRRGINVQPIIHPAVPERQARLRFFLSSLHEPEQIEANVAAVAEEVAQAGHERISRAVTAAKLTLS